MFAQSLEYAKNIIINLNLENSYPMTEHTTILPSKDHFMKAVICREYGPPNAVKIEDWPNPVPGVGEILVSIEAAGLTSGDARIRGARVPRLRTH